MKDKILGKKRLSEYRIYRYLWPYKWLFAAMLVLSSVFTAGEGATAYATKIVIDALQAYDWDAIVTVSIQLLGLAAILAIADFGKIYLGRYVAYRVDYNLRNDLCEHLLGLSMSFFNNKRNGDLMSNMTNDIGTANYALMITFEVLTAVLQVVSMTVAAWFLKPALGLAMLAIMPFIWYPSWRYRTKIRRASAARLSKLADLTQDMTQLLTGIRTVKAFRMEQQEIEDFRDTGTGVLRKSMKATRAKAKSDSLTTLISRTGAALFTLGAGYLVVSRRVLSMGDAIAFVGMVGITYKGIKTLSKDFTSLQETLPGSERLFAVFDVKPEITDDPLAVPLTAVQDSIAFRNVNFGYGDPLSPVLKDVNLDVKVGTIVAIVGPSGAGKSTMLDLIPRFYDPQRGSVLVDGIDIRMVTRDSLSSHIAIVGQQPFLFNTTIAENIRYGRQSATMPEVMEAARAANIHDFIQELPEGYDTIVGEQGVRLSGGQRQRLTIARAILKNAPILLLDEATSSLDNESEKAVQAGLNNLMKNRTTFVIAHRLSTVQHAHRIIVLKEGRIVEDGTHERLLAAGGEYSKLYRSEIRHDADPPAEN
ncbi:MAG TPA: ABC transporter ATP-binding protein [Planctomycetota bacterium]|nr:ABC transporter ATP-binding protein [Planctomycetota bacterium]